MLTLIRRQYRQDGVFGALVDRNDIQIAVTLEHAYPGVDGFYLPKVPPGQYSCMRGMHRLHSGGAFETFEVMGVPGHTGILFHAGNFNRDSEGCILLGLRVVEADPMQWVSDSRAALMAFLECQTHCDEFTLTVVG